jgi:WD40 repeat protein
MKNGELIHGINKPLEEQELDKTKTIKRRENNEISYMLYLSDDKLLLTSSWDSTIRIYDEQEPEESSLLRIMSGAHRDSDIITMDYSSHLSLLASGSANGMIAIWDFESGKIESICLGHHADITALKFIDEYPLLISGSADGTLCLWAVRPSHLHQNNINNCLLRMIHSEWRFDGSEQRMGINSIFVVTGNEVDGTVKGNVEGVFPNPNEYRDHIKFIIEPKEKETMKASTLTRSTLSNKQQNDQEKEKEKALEEARNNYLAPSEDTFWCPLNRPKETVDYYETLEDFTKYKDTAENDATQKKPRVYIYYADQKGYVNVLDLTQYLKRRNIAPCPSRKKSDGYQLRRKEWIDVTKVVENSLSSIEKAKKPFYTVHSFNSLLVRRWEAHSLAINDLSKVEDPPSFISCSPDKRVKIWSLAGELIGDLNLVKLGSNIWKFPFDWVKYKLAELDEVFDVLKLIERDENAIKPKEKDSIKLKYMVTSYGTENDFFNFYFGEEPIIPEKRIRKLELIEKNESTKRELPAFLEPRDPRLIVKEYKQPEKKEQEVDKYNFWAKGYKEGEIPLKILKALEDKEKELDNIKSGSANQTADGKRFGDKKNTRFMEPPAGNKQLRASLPSNLQKAGK